MTKAKQVNEATASPAEPVVSEVGAGEDARQVVRVGSWELAAWTWKGERDLRISEVELGHRLAYARPENIVQTIDRLVAAGKFNENEFLHTPWENRSGRGRPRKGTNGGMRWLTEEQALLVATQSETAVAWELTREMARVFKLARHGLLPSQSSGVSAEQFEAMLDRAAKAGAAVALAEVAMADLPVVRPGDEHRLGRGIGKNSAEMYILEPLREIARIKAKAICNDRDVSTFQSILKMADTELRRVLGHSTFLKWEQLPIALLDEAANALARMRVDAENLVRRSGFVRDASGQWVRSQANAKQLELAAGVNGRRGRRRRRVFDDAAVRATDRVLFGIDRDASKEPN